MTKLSVIVPVYNEEDFIEESLEKLTTVGFPIDVEVIVVDDGSTDNTPSVLDSFKKKSGKDIVIIRKENGGKGSALRGGIKNAEGDVITFHDADLEYDPRDLKVLLGKLLESDKNTVVYGSRFLDSNNNWAIPSHYIGNKLLSLFITLMYGKKVGDMETCYKMFYASALEGIDLVSDRFEIEPEITSKFLKKGLTIKEFPIRYTPRNFEEGKKINYRDGVKALFTILKYRFSK